MMFGTMFEKGGWLSSTSRKPWFNGGGMFRGTMLENLFDRGGNLFDRGGWFSSYRKPAIRGEDVLKGMGAGLIGGLVGTVVMTQFQTLVGKLIEQVQGSGGEEASGGNGWREEAEQEQEAESATAKTATAVSTRVFRHELRGQEKAVAGSTVHYGFGTTMGGIYGALAEADPRVTACAGTAFGSVLWLLADEVAVPAMRLSGPPTKMPVSSHVNALAAHLVYGFTTEMVRRAVRSWW
jgi:hypothetical protein